MKLALLLSRIAFAAIATALILLSPPRPISQSVEAQTSNRDLIVKSDVKELPARSKRWALIIGVDRYADTQITPLEGAVNDAKLLADALVQYAGFPKEQVILLSTDQPVERHPTRGNILRFLTNLRGEVPKDGLLVVSFAGHGIERNNRGFLCSSDTQSSEIELLEDTAIDVDTLRQRIQQMRVKQVIVILDACRNDPSGRGITANQLTSTYAERFNFDVVNEGVEAFATLYATGVGSVAYEYKEKKHGYFTWTLVEGLKGAAANDRGEVTLAGLVKYLEDQVPRRVRLDLGQDKVQKPYLRAGGYKANELVIALVERASAVTNSSSNNSASLELSFWESIKNSSNVEEYQEYLKEYPSGRFAGLARLRIRQLQESDKKIADSKTEATIPTDQQTQAETYTEKVGGVTIEIVKVAFGSFKRGSPDSETDRDDDEGPMLEVTISKSFYMGKYEVTQKQWQAVAALPKVKIDLNADPSYFKGDNLPVEQVSWEEAVEFCARLSKATGKHYRLPTEAEWEFACRAGTKGMYAGNLDTLAWVANNSGRLPLSTSDLSIKDSKEYEKKLTENDCKTHPVGTKQANRWGLHDMHGNVWEWCQDFYLKNYYSQGPIVDPTGPIKGSRRTGRGGAWSYSASAARAAERQEYAASTRDSDIGFRIVRTLN